MSFLNRKKNCRELCPFSVYQVGFLKNHCFCNVQAMYLFQKVNLPCSHAMYESTNNKTLYPYYRLTLIPYRACVPLPGLYDIVSSSSLNILYFVIAIVSHFARDIKLLRDARIWIFQTCNVKKYLNKDKIYGYEQLLYYIMERRVVGDSDTVIKQVLELHQNASPNCNTQVFHIHVSYPYMVF